jgi:hypothetical protein
METAAFWDFGERLLEMAERHPGWRFLVPAWFWDAMTVKYGGPVVDIPTYIFGIPATVNRAQDPDALVAVSR